MASDIREYLAERFKEDANTLHKRAATLAGSNKPSPGPDAAASLAMAKACEEVTALVYTLPDNASLPDMLVALNALLPLLNARANDPALAKSPAVRSVYAGAIARVQEVIAAEARAAAAGALGYMDDDDDDVDFDDSDDPDADDDDITDDEDTRA